MNARWPLPDMHYRVIDVNGQPSDVVTITPDAVNSNVATMTAKKAGTAIVLVTYDAMIHKQGQSSTASKGVLRHLAGVHRRVRGDGGQRWHGHRDQHDTGPHGRRHHQR